MLRWDILAARESVVCANLSQTRRVILDPVVGQRRRTVRCGAGCSGVSLPRDAVLFDQTAQGAAIFSRFDSGVSDVALVRTE
jgi:hypothetical protein